LHQANQLGQKEGGTSVKHMLFRSLSAAAISEMASVF